VFLRDRKRKGKIRRASNGLMDDVNLISVDFPNRSEASAGSDLDTAMRGRSLQETPQLIEAYVTYSTADLSGFRNGVSVSVVNRRSHEYVSWSYECRVCIQWSPSTALYAGHQLKIMG